MFIYKITNKINNKCYIGQTVSNSLTELKNRYLKELKYSKRQRVIIKAIIKYGFENFKFNIVKEVQNKYILDESEIYYIKFFNTRTPNGYNNAKGGRTNRGCKWSEESKLQLSKKLKGKYKGKNNPFFGKTHSKETKLKIIKSNKKRIGSKLKPLTKERKQAISKANLGKIPWNKGIEYKAIRGKNNPNYKEIDKSELIKLLKNKKHYSYICKKLDISISYFYRKIEELKLKRLYNYAKTC